MALAWLDHVNIRTANLEAMTRFYAEVLGLALGPRPPFSFDGAWLYCGDKAVVHLVLKPGLSTADASIDHFAFRATGLSEFVSRLKANDVPYRITVVPQLELRQLRISDPDGNRIEIAFPPEEAVDPAELA